MGNCGSTPSLGWENSPHVASKLDVEVRSKATRGGGDCRREVDFAGVCMEVGEMCTPSGDGTVTRCTGCSGRVTPLSDARRGLNHASSAIESPEPNNTPAIRCRRYTTTPPNTSSVEPTRGSCRAGRTRSESPGSGDDARQRRISRPFREDSGPKNVYTTRRDVKGSSAMTAHVGSAATWRARTKSFVKNARMMTYVEAGMCAHRLIVGAHWPQR